MTRPANALKPFWRYAAIWRYLIAVSAAEVRRIPVTDDVGTLPAWVPQEAIWP